MNSEKNNTSGVSTVHARFYEAVDALRTERNTTLNAFCNRGGIDRRNLLRNREAVKKDTVIGSWLTFIVTEYGVSADWLITGRGSVFSDEK